jgi:hypothetical protein
MSADIDQGKVWESFGIVRDRFGKKAAKKIGNVTMERYGFA